MIPFASQRGGGQDLATHLLNAQDNEQVVLAHLRGAIAQDLHGALAEWELQADTLTNCRNYLYSLSINPDPQQGKLSTEQYLDYVARVEAALGLSGQPRALVLHVKYDRPHVHAVWSRIDADSGKAIHMAFDHEKLMKVTRQFAREHGITLPDGYSRDGDGPDKAGQLTLYEKHQQDTTGLTKEHRMEVVTDLWRNKESPSAFVRALGQNGYMLATGKRPYVLVDAYGNTHALPRLINDKNVRSKDVAAFLGKEFPPESLPSVEEAKKLAADHLKKMESFDKKKIVDEKTPETKTREARRRKVILDKIQEMKTRQLDQKRKLEAFQQKRRMALKVRYMKEVKRVKTQREKTKATGLAAFLGRVTGIDKVIRKVRRVRDRIRFEKYKTQVQTLEKKQAQQLSILRERHRMQLLDIRRQVRAVNKVEKREAKSRKTTKLRELRLEQRARRDIDHMPSIDMKSYQAVRTKVVKGQAAAKDTRNALPFSRPQNPAVSMTGAAVWCASPISLIVRARVRKKRVRTAKSLLENCCRSQRPF
ncbi:MAG: relaxase/mobilization nuclease domain-containing protein [Pseudomonadota bacterium]